MFIQAFEENVGTVTAAAVKAAGEVSADMGQYTEYCSSESEDEGHEGKIQMRCAPPNFNHTTHACPYRDGEPGPPVPQTDDEPAQVGQQTHNFFPRLRETRVQNLQVGW